jgi:hypothetical protein
MQMVDLLSVVNLPDAAAWPDIPRLENGWWPSGGAVNAANDEGIANWQAQLLAQRTRYLRDQMDNSGTGLAVAPTVANWDTVTRSGTYRSIAGAVGAPLPTGAFIGQHLAGAVANEAWQMLTSVANGRTWIRTRAAGAWGAWTELWTSAQSAVSFNNNGFVRLPNGLIHQWGRFLTTANLSTQAVNIVFPTSFPTACLWASASIGVAIADYDFSANPRNCRQDISVGFPTQTGVEMQAFMDNLIGELRVIHWQAIGS